MMKKIFYGLSAVVFAGALLLLLKPGPISVETLIVRKGPFDEVFSTDAKIRSRDRQTVYAFATGDLAPFQVKEGDAVEKGQVLSKLEWDRTLRVKAPMKGVITKIYRESGGPVTRGEPVFKISGLKELEVIASLLTTDAVRIAVGTPVIITNWGGTGAIEAQVSQVSRAGDVKVSALGVEEERTEVIMELKGVSQDVQSKLGDNYHVDVKFLISQEKEVLTLPLGALFRLQDNWACYVVEKNRAKLRQVSISKRSDQMALVTDGLREGETVILFPSDQVTDGVSVKSLDKR